MHTLDRGASPIDELLERSRSLMETGRPREAIDLLTAAHHERGDHRLATELVRLRHEAMGPASDAPPAAGSAWPPPVPDLLADQVLPELTADELTSELLASALQHHGCLIVRGLFDRSTADALLADARRAFAAFEAASDGTGDGSPQWHVPFEAHESYSFGPFERAFARYGDGLLTVESPTILAEVISAFHRARIGELLEEYFGEWPALSAKKSTIRGASSASLTGWHQDGAFLGAHTRTVNTWVALTSCGEDAPSIDIFATPLDHIVETGTEGAHWDWSVSPDRAEQIGLEHVRRPCFEPGDALVFNQLSLHRTGVSPEMSQNRVAIESWFFAPSTYPQGQVPILF